MLVPLERGQFGESFPNTCSHWHVRITGWACPHVEIGILSWSTIWSMVTFGGRLFSPCSGRQSPSVNCPHNGPKNIQPDFLIRCTVKHSTMAEAMSINASWVRPMHVECTPPHPIPSHPGEIGVCSHPGNFHNTGQWLNTVLCTLDLLETMYSDCLGTLVH